MIMPDLYTQIANGSYGRTSDRWKREPDFDEITRIDEDGNDGEDEDYSLLDAEYDELI
jgi:hypothetical protein